MRTLLNIANLYCKMNLCRFQQHQQNWVIERLGTDLMDYHIFLSFYGTPHKCIKLLNWSKMWWRKFQITNAPITKCYSKMQCHLPGSLDLECVRIIDKLQHCLHGSHGSISVTFTECIKKSEELSHLSSPLKQQWHSWEKLGSYILVGSLRKIFWDTSVLKWGKSYCWMTWNF